MEYLLRNLLLFYVAALANNSFADGFGSDWGANSCQHPNLPYTFSVGDYKTLIGCSTSHAECVTTVTEYMDKYNISIQRTGVSSGKFGYNEKYEFIKKYADEFCELTFPTKSSSINNLELYEASSQGQIKRLNKLLANRANPNAREPSGHWTALQVSSKKGYLDTVKALLKFGADPNAENRTHATALQIAAGAGRFEIVKVLLKSGAKINALNKHGLTSTALDNASWYGHNDVVKLLLDNGADPNIHGKHSAPFFNALKQNHITTLKILAKNKAGINNRYGFFNETVLEVAVQKREIDAVKILIAAGADVNSTHAKGGSALNLAAEKGLLNIIKLLLSAGADITVRRYGRTALYSAEKSQHAYVVKFLLENTVEKPHDASVIEEAFLLSVKGGYTDLVKKILKQGVEFDSDTLSTALEYAEDERYSAIEQLLISVGAEASDDTY